MPLTNLPGLLADSPSIRLNVTETAGSAFAFVETKTRPVVVAAQTVDVSPVARSTAATLPPERSAPYGQLGARGSPVRQVRRPDLVGSPSLTQSPHVTSNLPVKVLHWLRNVARSIVPMPCVFVRQTCEVPTNIVLLTLGSEMIGT